jgi:DNA-binding transcriptional MerR regulator
MYREPSPKQDELGLKLDELAEKAEVSARTVRYYVQRGLLAPPVFRGRDTVYGEGHLLRLRLIKRLQDERFLPLDAIAAELAGKSDAEVRALLERMDRSERRAVTAAPTGPVRVRARHGDREASERWTRVTIADGVELSVRDDVEWDVARLLREAMRRRRE